MATRTDAQLTTDANVIKNETAPGANTATRIGNMLIDLVDSKANLDETSSPADLAAGLATKAAKTQSAWTNLTLIAPWTDAGNVGFPPRYRLTDTNKLELAGKVYRASGGSSNVLVTSDTLFIAGSSCNRAVPNLTDQTFAYMQIASTGLSLFGVPDNKTIDIGSIIPYDGGA
jgi:hypothetical protein